MHFMWFTERAYHYDPEEEPGKYRELENEVARKRSFFGTPNRFFERQHGARLGAIFSSDIGHWDVPDMTEVLEEAYELVEHEIITETDFRDFVFTNPVKMWGMNPGFFKGTVVEKDVAKLLNP